MSTFNTLSETAKTREEQLIEAMTEKRNPILHDGYYRGDTPIIFRDLLTNQLHRLNANQLTFRHLEEIAKNTVKVEKNGDSLIDYLRQLYPGREFTFSLYGDNAEHIVCELQAKRLGTCVVGIAEPDGSVNFLLARQLPLGFEEDLINENRAFYGSRKSYIDYTNYIIEVLCSEKNLDPETENAETTATDYEAAPIPVREEIFKKRTQPVVTNVNKICDKFPLAVDSWREVPDFHRKPADVIDISKVERDVCENVRLFYWPAQNFFECHPLDLTLEELIGIYQGSIFIAYNEQSFYKYETLIRTAHGMKP